MNIKIKYSYLKVFLFIMVVFIYGIVSANSNLTGEGIFSSSSILKYGSLFLLLSVSLLDFHKLNLSKKEVKLRKEYSNFLLFFIVISVLSLIAFMNSWIISLRIFQTFFFTFIPMLLGYLIINTWHKKEIDFAIKISIIICFLEYLLSLNMSVSNILRSFVDTDYANTNSSLLESNTFPLLALGLFIYFCYYKKNIFFTVLSFVFVLMTFKRVVMFTAIILFIISRLKLKDLRVSKICLLLSIFFILIISFSYFWVIEPQHILQSSRYLNIDLRAFSTNRTDRLAWLDASNFVSYGFGSSTDFMYKTFGGLALEMDIVALVVELGWISVVAFITCYLRFAKGNFYIFVAMTLLLLNSIFSSGMSSTFGWLIILVSMSSILVDSCDKKIGE